MDIITFQPEFRSTLPVVFASKDYDEFRATLVEMDRILTATGIENRFIGDRIKTFDQPLSQRQLQYSFAAIRLALRYNILLGITGHSFRKLALRVADSQLFQWFTHTGSVDAVRPVSKSTISWSTGCCCATPPERS